MDIKTHSGHVTSRPLFSTNFSFSNRLILQVFCIGLAVSLTACKSLSGNTVQQDTRITTAEQPAPKWVKNPPGDSTHEIYGLGSGTSLEMAKQNALNDIASKLEVHVSSSTEYQSYLKGDQFNSSFKERIQAQVKQTRLSNFQIVETAVSNGQNYALLAMSRDALIKDTKTELDKAESAVNLVLKGVDQKSKLEQIAVYGEARDKMLDLLPTVAMMSAANPGFSNDPYYQKLKRFAEQEKDLTENAVFLIRSDGDLKDLAKRLEFRMVENGFRVTHGQKADSIIDLSGNLTKSEIFSSYAVHGDVRISVKNAQGKQLYSNLYRVNGSSVSGHAQAQELAFKKFETSLQGKDDIFKILGLTP